MKEPRVGKLFALSLVALLTACSDSATAPTTPMTKTPGRPSFVGIEVPALDSVTPHAATVAAGGTQQFTPWDLTGAAMSPALVSWSVSGGGAIDATGLFTAGTTAGTFTVTVVDSRFAPNLVTVTSSVTVTVASACKDDDHKDCEDDGGKGDDGHGGKDHGDKDHGGKDGGNDHHDRGHGGKNDDQDRGGKNGDGKGKGHGG